ncbi:MAG: hypothetical protein HY791_01090 [Deltaproteobacteria bacterium]|nr:hypothetical protein [Deltaproteobacteria bacterium]
MQNVIPIAALLRVLEAHEVEFIVVGGVSAVLNGAPISTIDLDIVHRRTPENVRRLVAALGELNAVFRSDPRGLRPTEAALMGLGHQLLTTKFGVLDVLGSVEAGTTYEDLLPDTYVLDLDDSQVRTLTLRRLILTKERVGRPKDLAVLPILRATLEEISSVPPPDSEDEPSKSRELN